jgi:hypothetical protein
MKIGISFRSLLFTLGMITLILGCNQNKKEEKKEGLKGHYVNSSVLNRVRDTIASSRPAYCYELYFISKDSVRIFYGFEEATFAYERLNDNYFHKYVIKKAVQGQDLKFTIDPGDYLTLNDTAWTKAKMPSDFTKTYPADPEKWTFLTELNKEMIAGTYGLFEKDLPKFRQAVFSPDGKVTGFGDFTSYELCFSGDCVEEISPVSNSITFTDSKGNSMTYAAEFGRDKKFKLFNIEKPKTDIKGERKITNLAFDLRPI